MNLQMRPLRLPVGTLRVTMLLSVSASALLSCLVRREDDQTPPQNECTTCHGDNHEQDLSGAFAPAPPYNLSGDTSSSARGNGAHLAHLIGGPNSRPVACQECHLVPQTTDQEGHIDTPYPAEVIFKGPAKAFEAAPVFDVSEGSCKDTFCHGDYFVGGRPSGGRLTEPQWIDTSGAPAACGACHGLPPPLPHPLVTTCSDCHKTMDEEGNITFPELHVNGVVNFNLPKD